MLSLGALRALWSSLRRDAGATSAEVSVAALATRDRGTMSGEHDAIICGLEAALKELDLETIDFSAFVALLLVVDLHYRPRPKAEALAAFYAALDAGGGVRRQDFESFLLMMTRLRLLQRTAPERYDALWEEYDANATGSLGYREFVLFAKEVLNLLG